MTATEMKVRLTVKEGVLLAPTLLLAPILVAELFGVAEMRRAFTDTSPEMPQFADLLVAVASAAAIIVLRLVLTAVFAPVGRLVLAPAKRQTDRVERFATVLFKFTFFVAITVVGFVVMRDEPWFPVVLGGEGEVAKSFETVQTPPSRDLKLYFMVQLGYHVHSLVYMLVLSPIRNDFLEMLLHHVATIILIGGSFLANFTAFGALVVFTHDIGDVTGYAIKSAVDTGHTPLVVLLYAVLLGSWGYTRLFVFPFHLIHGSAVVLPESNPEVLALFLDPMNVMLGMLQLLHVYWYTLFLVMGYVLLTKGKHEDIQQQCATDEAEAEETSNSGRKNKQE